MSKKPVTSSFVLGVIFNVNPKQTPRTTPAIENDSVVKGLVYRSHNQRVVFVRFLFPSRSPMEHECSEPKLSQARADIMSVIGADSFFLYADVNEIIVNRRVALHAVVPRALQRRAMSRLRQQLGFTRINGFRRERDQSVPQIRD